MDDQLHHAIMHLYPQTTQIVEMRSYRPGYLPYPARLTLQTTTGATMVCVLKVDADADKLAYEALVIRALAELELPVPHVIAGPITLLSTLAPSTMMMMSELPGRTLPWISLTDLATANRTCHLVHAAVERLHTLTPAVLAHPIATQIPSRTLEAEIQTIRARRSAWMDVPLFSDALNLVQAAIPQYRSPLVFSNGDYNPLNFLVADDALVGWIDFEYACFEDPYIGFAKFLLWADDAIGWGAGAKVGLVERFLYTHHVSPVAFLVRLVLRGLTHLQDTSPIDPPAFMLQVICNAVHRLKQEFDG